MKNFTSLGIDSIYPWQSSCLLGRGILNGETNLVYSAPTGGGKSLVADVVMLKRVIEDPKKKAILVLPVRVFGAFSYILQLLAAEAAGEETCIYPMTKKKRAKSHNLSRSGFGQTRTSEARLIVAQPLPENGRTDSESSMLPWSRKNCNGSERS